VHPRKFPEGFNLGGADPGRAENRRGDKTSSDSKQMPEGEAAPAKPGMNTPESCTEINV